LSGINGRNGHQRVPLLALAVPEPLPNGLLPSSLDGWRDDIRRAVSFEVVEFVTARCAADLSGAGVDIATELLTEFVDGGKCVRSTFTYLGWLCGADDDVRALRAAASFELLHAFALLQDDVMDGSALRRGRPAAHVSFAQWHRDRALSRAWPRYDAMRTELAVGQFADLVNDAAEFPTWTQVLDVLRRKSGNYTVRRPLEIGAALAGCGSSTLDVLGGYGEAVGEAFQLRDDVLGIFGSPAVTGKPAGSDLSEHKATSVVAAAYHLADPGLRRELAELMRGDDLSESDIDRWRALIVATGALEWIEQLMDQRLSHALDLIDAQGLAAPIRTALAAMAAACTERTA
jgi:geranylgeranyl diphosphate synthase type I